MSDDDRICPECGGHDGNHFDGCIYEGTNGPARYHSHSSRSSGSGNSTGAPAGLVFALLIILIFILVYCPTLALLIVIFLPFISMLFK